jgi:putative phage-type endonuclease
MSVSVTVPPCPFPLAWATTPQVVAVTAGMDRATWLATRRQGLGGSDAAAVLGVSRYRGPWDTWADKTGAVPPADAGEAAYWGQQLEPLVADEFARRTGLAVAPWPVMLRHPTTPWMLADLDRVVADGGLLECKTTGAHHAEEWADGGIPPEYVCQVQHYLAVTGAPHAYLAVLIGGQRFHWCRLDRDDAFIADLLAAEAAFWDLVVTRTPPPPDGSPGARRVLQALHPAPTGGPVVLPDTAAAWARAYLDAAQREQLAAADKERAAQALMALLGDAPQGTAGSYRVLWTPMTRRSFDFARFRAEHPDLYAAYSMPQPTRRFAVLPAKEDA